jgi:hypothetical protein
LGIGIRGAFSAARTAAKQKGGRQLLIEDGDAAKKRCQQDSNLQPPVPETDALPLRHDTLFIPVLFI